MWYLSIVFNCFKFFEKKNVNLVPNETAHREDIEETDKCRGPILKNENKKGILSSFLKKVGYDGTHTRCPDVAKMRPHISFGSICSRKSITFGFILRSPPAPIRIVFHWAISVSFCLENVAPPKLSPSNALPQQQQQDRLKEAKNKVVDQGKWQVRGGGVKNDSSK